ncbi:hypothetical protein BGX30_007525 [Mortierella sp. GBA39]|nr:hypothetical protein BGX30_007525 [Mortierella sp. GBA39]
MLLKPTTPHKLKVKNVAPSLMNSKAHLATSASALDGRPRSLAITYTAKDTNFTQDETTEHGNSMIGAFAITLPPKGRVTSVPAPVPAPASRGRIRLDPTPPHILILDRYRVNGLLKRLGEETLCAALRRAEMEYVEDKALRQELIIAKRESLKAQLHATLPVGIQNKNMLKNCTGNRFSGDERHNRKHVIDNGVADDRATKKYRASEQEPCASSSFSTSTHSSVSTRMPSSCKHTDMSRGAKEDSTKENSTVDHVIFRRTVTNHTKTERINHMRFNSNRVNISASNNTERNVKKNSLDLTDDHPTPSHQAKKPQPDDHSAIQYLGNNNIITTTTNRPAQEFSASSTVNCVIKSP